MKNTIKTYQKSLIHLVFAALLGLFIVNQLANTIRCIDFCDDLTELCEKESGEENESEWEEKLLVTAVACEEQESFISLMGNSAPNLADMGIVKGIPTPPPEA